MVEKINDSLGIFHDARALALKVFKKIGLYQIRVDDIEHFTTFDEFPECEMCGSHDTELVFEAIDGCKVVECQECKLWFTSPRINEAEWIKWLKDEDTDRNKILTENRYKYGVAMPHNVKLTRSGWFKRHQKEDKKIINLLNKYAEKPIGKLHDIGCGVGFFLMTCRENGMQVSGNDLNEYAVRLMRNRFDLDVYHGMIGELDLPLESYDAITMNAFIEHTYHPLGDLKKACSLLSENGLIYVSTFHIDSKMYDLLGKKWDMFAWNHVYHFSSETLQKMMELAGFNILLNKMDYDLPVSYILGQKKGE